MRKTYFAVKWGETIRVSQPVYDAEKAKRDCYGLATPDMECIPLGQNKKSVSRLVHKGLDKLDWKKGVKR